MSSLHKKPPRGSRPGTLADVSHFPPPIVNVIEYTETECLEYHDVDDAKLVELLSSDRKLWVDVQGLGDAARLLRLAEIFDLHELVIADVANVPQRPKTEPYGDYHFCVSRMVWFDPTEGLHWEQTSIVYSKKFVLTFEEDPGDVFDPIRERLRAGNALRTRPLDYLAYALIDTVVDAYFPVLDGLGRELDALEEEVLLRPTQDSLTELARVKNVLSRLRRVVIPQREAVLALLHEDTSFASAEVRLFLRDTSDHCSQLSEIIESQREIVSGLTNTYLSVVANRTNEVMKVLTIMTTIFIPLSFVAGVYGMNFENMPELRARHGYHLTLASMVLLAGLMLLYFRRKGWILQRPPQRDRRA